jgi:hypothetical protein
VLSNLFLSISESHCLIAIMRFHALFVVATALVPATYAQVVGKPFGMASAATGGGNAAPVVAKDIKELGPFPHLYHAMLTIAASKSFSQTTLLE